MPSSSKQCYVIMPAGNKGEFHSGEAESASIYGWIKRGLEAEPIAGCKILVELETDKSNPGAITKSILKNLIQSDICIADLTGNNANVLLELGMRYCFRPGLTILIAQDVERIHSDIKGQRAIEYSTLNKEGLLEKLKNTIRIEFADAPQAQQSTSIVYDWFPDANFSCSLTASGDQYDHDNVMPCHEYWDRIDRFAKQLKTLNESGAYIPSALIGLEDGGAAFADFVGRSLKECGHHILVQGLVDSDNDFKSRANDLMLTNIRDQLRQSSGPYNILMLDDYVATGRCARLAKQKIKRDIPEADVHFLPLVSTSKGALSDLFEEKLLFWAHEPVARTMHDIEDMHYIEWSYFPDKKKMRKE